MHATFEVIVIAHINKKITMHCAFDTLANEKSTYGFAPYMRAVHK